MWCSGKESTCRCRRCNVPSLDQEDPLEKEMATHSSILAWKISGTEEPGRLQSTGLQRVRHSWATAHAHISMHLIWLAHRMPPTHVTILITEYGSLLNKSILGLKTPSHFISHRFSHLLIFLLYRELFHWLHPRFKDPISPLREILLVYCSDYWFTTTWMPRIFLSGEFHGQRRLVGYRSWNHKESDTTEQLTFNLWTRNKNISF